MLIGRVENTMDQCGRFVLIRKPQIAICGLRFAVCGLLVADLYLRGQLLPRARNGVFRRQVVFVKIRRDTTSDFLVSEIGKIFGKNLLHRFLDTDAFRIGLTTWLGRGTPVSRPVRQASFASRRPQPQHIGPPKLYRGVWFSPAVLKSQSL